MPSQKVLHRVRPSYFKRIVVIVLVLLSVYFVVTKEQGYYYNLSLHELKLMMTKVFADPNLPSPRAIDKAYNPVHAVTPLWKNQNDVVHILTTRFMQLQPDLIHLGKARLDLFKTFTLPSVTAQTTNEFLWLIFTDPKLHPVLLKELMDILEPHKNIVLIGMNQIFGDFVYEDWVDNIEVIFTGDIQKIKDYRAAARTHVLLQTRLDADDSMFRDLMKNVQLQAAETLGQQAKEFRYNPDWLHPRQYRIFCSENHLEWGYFNPWDSKSSKGHLFGVEKMPHCIVSGLTYVYQVGTKSKDLPTRAHHKLLREIPRCDAANRTTTNCVDWITDGGYYYSMLRSRTPTSTAMSGVIPRKKVVASKLWKERQDVVWEEVIEHNFNVMPSSIFQLRENFKSNMKSILGDALKGQCSKKEFGCKNSTITSLNRLLSQVEKLS